MRFAKLVPLALLLGAVDASLFGSNKRELLVVGMQWPN